jgi:hypothetical protein
MSRLTPRVVIARHHRVGPRVAEDTVRSIDAAIIVGATEEGTSLSRDPAGRFVLLFQSDVREFAVTVGHRRAPRRLRCRTDEPYVLAGDTLRKQLRRERCAPNERDEDTTSETNAVECGEQHLRPSDSCRSAGQPASFGLSTQETLVEEQTL